MTHTLHREGDLADLAEDFVVLSMSAKNVNAAGSAGRLKPSRYPVSWASWPRASHTRSTTP